MVKGKNFIEILYRKYQHTYQHKLKISMLFSNDNKISSIIWVKDGM